MKIHTFMLVAPLVFGLPKAALAQGEEAQAAHLPEGAAQPASEPAQAGAPQAAATATTGAVTPLQETRQTLTEQMQAIRGTRDPEERRRLLGEHTQTMQDMMKMVHGMMEAESTLTAVPGMGGGRDMMSVMPGGRGMGMMGGCPMMGMMHGGRGMGMGPSRGMMGGMMREYMAMQQRVAALEQRLNAMQTVVEQLLKHEEALAEQ